MRLWYRGQAPSGHGADTGRVARKKPPFLFAPSCRSLPITPRPELLSRRERNEPCRRTIRRAPLWPLSVRCSPSSVHSERCTSRSCCADVGRATRGRFCLGAPPSRATALQLALLPPQGQQQINLLVR